MTTFRSTRPVMIASWLTGVTRNRSMTPARQSEMIANATNVEAEEAELISRPGTKNLYAPAVPAALVLPLSGTLVSSGPNRARYRIGCTSAMITQAGLRC